MTSLLDTARRLVQLGKTADMAEPDSVYGIALFLNQFCYGPGSEDGKALLMRSLPGITKELTEAAHSADRLAAALIEAVGHIQHLAMCVTCAEDGLDACESGREARAFLSSLNAKPGDAE